MSELQELIERARTAPADARAATRLLPLLDLTSLRGDETADEIRALCARAVSHSLAAVCIDPRHLNVARTALADSGVRLATVAAFPGGGDDIAAAAEEVAAVVRAGAQEVDLVAPLGAIGEGDLASVSELVAACRAAVGPDIVLKLILETGRLADPPLIAAVARAAVMAGVDFLKTSTGKVPQGASLEAVGVLIGVIEESGGRVGLKVSGGIRRVPDAAPYVALVDATLGPAWATPARLRFGASALLDDLVRVLGLPIG